MPTVLSVLSVLSVLAVPAVLAVPVGWGARPRMARRGLRDNDDDDDEP